MSNRFGKGFKNPDFGCDFLNLKIVNFQAYFIDLSTGKLCTSLQNLLFKGVP